MERDFDGVRPFKSNHLTLTRGLLSASMRYIHGAESTDNSLNFIIYKKIIIFLEFNRKIIVFGLFLQFLAFPDTHVFWRP
jgi:hypothetical protein